MPSTHIDHVIRRLEYVIQWALKNNSRIGYFACLYERVTIEVDSNLDLQYFKQNDEMMRFDIIFAEYYLLAFEGYMRGEEIPKVWQLAFDKTNDPRLTVLQHLLLGMNAHINLDLAVTVSNVATPDTLDDLKGDFYAINKVLSSLVDLVQDQIGEIYKSVKFFDRLFGRLDEKLVDKLMARYRDRAWQLAVELTNLHGHERIAKIKETDENMAKWASRYIGKPVGRYFPPLQYFITRRESNNIERIIKTLHQGSVYDKWDKVL